VLLYSGPQNEMLMTAFILPESLKPRDGRFGCGPSKVRPEAVARLSVEANSLLGTSHRQPRVKNEVGRLAEGIRTLFQLPDDYELLFTVGGATAFWDAAAYGLIEQRARHYVFGEFSGKFASVTTAAPWLDTPDVVTVAAGSVPAISTAEQCDVQAITHNETSTGAMLAPTRIDDALVVVDATSGAGGLPVNISDADVYYFSLQKGFASEGGLTVAILSPRAVERINSIAASGRYIPDFFNLSVALENSRKNQTYNTLSISTVFLAAEQVHWQLDTFGSLDGVVAEQRRKSSVLYDWAERTAYTTPFVTPASGRSLVVGTIDLDAAVSADDVNATLRANGILDTDPYRKLGRNQLRVGMFPAVDAADVEAYTACVDAIVAALN